MDDISFLVNETFKAVENHDQSQNVPEASGLLYVLAQNDSTFVIKGLPSKNLKNDYDNFFENNLAEKLKIEVENKKEIFWFETPFWERSELILELAAGKRFLKSGERLSNLSDPQLHWSLIVKPGKILIDLSGRKKRNLDQKNLGYLGEVSIALKRFSEILSRQFKDVIEINELHDGELFSKFYDLFTYRKLDADWFEHYFQSRFQANQVEALMLYLEEVQMMLEFWQLIHKQLKTSE